MQNTKLGFLFLNVGHFLDHFFMLVFATAAALQLTQEWGLSYAELVPYATPGFIAFGVGAIPAGWIADKWSRQGMMVIFFIGIGLSSVLASLANNPLQIALALTAIGLFAAIYHPVGLAMVVQGRYKTGMPLAINGVFGNLGVASAALITGMFIDASGWRSAFMVTGLISVLIGCLYWAYVFTVNANVVNNENQVKKNQPQGLSAVVRPNFVRVFSIVFFTTALGGLIFQSTTFALPKIFAERLSDQTYSATLIGQYAFVVFSVAAIGQLVVGYLLDRCSLRTVFAWVAACQILFFAAMIQLTGTAVVLVGMAFMLAVFGQIPINDVLVGRMVQSEWRSRAYALRYIVSFTIMASVVPLIAWIHGNWSFSVLFLVLALAASLILLAVLSLPKLEPDASTVA